MNFSSLSMCMTMIAIASRAVITADAQSTQGLRVEIDFDSNHKGLCKEALYSAVEIFLSEFGESIANGVLKQHGLKADDFVFEPFHLGSVNVRARNLLRGNRKDEIAQDESEQQEEAGVVQVDDKRVLATYVKCTCTKTSCASWCSGCYLCSSDRRSLTENKRLLTADILKEVEAALQGNIEQQFFGWITKGPGAALSVGCMGDPTKLQISLNLLE